MRLPVKRRALRRASGARGYMDSRERGGSLAVSLSVSPPRPIGRDKLGLALAGGGFRASLFHLGVLRRMAELDLLRYVEVLSTVSGGSIIGALYVLLLKNRVDRSPVLGRDEYVAIVDELQRDLVEAIQKDLRTRLFMNPLGILRVLLTSHSLGKRMARLYERYLYRTAVEQLVPRKGWRRGWRPGRLPLTEVRFSPGGSPPQGGLEAYNGNAVATHGSAITNLILNATALNSGTPFRFSSVEIGDPQLGFFRWDEIDILRGRKSLLQGVGESELRATLSSTASGPASIRGVAHDRRTIALALWWRARRKGTSPPAPAGWRLFQQGRFPGGLPEATFGQLRQVKLPAWYLRQGVQRVPPITGGISAPGHLERFWQVLRGIDEDLTADLQAAAASDPAVVDELLDFVLEFYYLRSAEMMSPRLRSDWERLSLGEAVGASACFPPVFPPFVVLGIYDDLHVTRLGLTDGGVYDNLGVATLLDEGCTHIISSDTGGVPRVVERVSTGRVGMLTRILNGLWDEVGDLQRRGLRERRRVSRGIAQGTGTGPDWQEVLNLYQLLGLSFFHVSSPDPGRVEGLQVDLDRDAVAQLRTDLDAFGDVEIAVLVNRGYDAGDRFLRAFLAQSAFSGDRAYWTVPNRVPMSLPADPGQTRRVLKAGQYRFGRSLLLGSGISWAFTLAAVAALMWGTWRVPFSIQSAVEWIANHVIAWIRSTPYVGPWLVQQTLPLGAVLLLVAAMVLVARSLWPRMIATLRQRYPRIIRPALSGAKWARGISWNLLWVLGGTPLWIALGGAGIAWVSFLFYSLPFLRRTRVDGG